MTDSILKEFERLISREEWRFAKTYANVCPHWYIVRKSGAEQSFAYMVNLIRELGFIAHWKGKAGIYFIHGDYYYWTMGEPVEKTIIINRARLTDYDLYNREWRWNGIPVI